MLYREAKLRAVSSHAGRPRRLELYPGTVRLDSEVYVLAIGDGQSGIAPC